MRLIHLFEESSWQERFANKIKVECGYWLSQIPFDKPFYRGLQSENSLVPVDIKQNRPPRNSSYVSHTLMNKLISQIGLKANRSNSIFATSDKSLAYEFGKLHIVIPIGTFNYTWSPRMPDATLVITDLFPNYIIDYRPLFAERKDEILNKIKNMDPIFRQYNINDERKIEFILNLNASPPYKIILYLNHCLKTFAIEEFPILFDTEKLQHLYKGDDDSLLQAFESRHEIMIKGKTAYVIKEQIYNELLEFF